MSPPTKRVQCDCGWSYESDDEEALVRAVQDHARDSHGIAGLTREQALAQARPV